MQAVAETARVAAEGAELAAGGGDVVASPAAHRGHHPAPLQARLEGVDPGGVRRHHVLAQDRVGVDRDQVDLRAQPPEPARQGVGVGEGVVEVPDQDVLDGQLATPLEGIARERRHQLRHRVAAVDRHEGAPPLVVRRVERDRQVRPVFPGGHGVDPRHDAGGRDRDPPPGDGLGQHVERAAHRLEVHQRLAHAHEHQVVAGRRQIGVAADGQHLAQDLPRRQVAARPPEAGDAEPAGQTAAGLARDAEGAARAVRDVDRLDRRAGGPDRLAGVLRRGGSRPAAQTPRSGRARRADRARTGT